MSDLDVLNKICHQLFTKFVTKSNQFSQNNSETIFKSLSLLFTKFHSFPRNVFGHHPLSSKMLPNKDYNLIYLGEVWNKGCKTVSRNTPNFGNGAFQKDFLVKQQPSNTSDQQIRLRIDSWWCPSRTPDGVTVTYGGLASENNN